MELSDSTNGYICIERSALKNMKRQKKSWTENLIKKLEDI